MSRDDLRVRVHYAQRVSRSRDQPIDRTTTRRVDEREAVPEEGVAHVHDVGFDEVHDRVTIGMRILDMERMQPVAVDVEGHVVGEGYDGERTVW